MNRRDFIGLSLSAGASAAFDPVAFARALSADGTPKTLVLGGGVFALGFALAHPQETLVLERGIHLGLDYAGTSGPVAPGTPHTELGRELIGRLTAVGILRDGAMELPPLADFLAAFFAERGGRSFMAADLVGLERKNGGYRLHIVGGGSEGVSTFDVADILDVTDAGWRDFGAKAIVSKRFAGLAPDFSYFNVELPASAGWHEARLRLYAAWKAAGHDPGEMLAETNAIKCCYGPGRVERWNGQFGFPWIPSGQFPDLMTAFEEGFKWKSA